MRFVRVVALEVTALMAVMLCGAVNGCFSENKSEKEVGHLRQIDHQIERFRSGEEFDGRIDIYLSDGEPDAKAVERLARALRSESESVREQVAKTLVALGRETDALYSDGGNLIRNIMIIDVLVKDGLRGPGPGRDYCLEALQWSVPASLLKPQAPGIVSNSADYPDPTALLVLAKMKAGGAEALIDSLATQERWRRQEETWIAKAALGDKEVEEKYITDFLSVTDAEEKASLARKLGFIGTKSALKALGSEMRSSLIIEKPMVMVRSIRVDIVAALSYAFPERPFLWDNAVIDDGGYERIEKFCEEELGVEWKAERPPFLWIQGFPSDIGQE